MSREIGMLREIGISRPPKQSPVHTMIPKSPQSPKEFDSSGGLTSLEPDTVRYLNKRKPMDKSRASMYTFHTTRANAFAFLPIFQGLDNNNTGRISLTEIAGAVTYLSKPSNGQKPIFQNPKIIMKFFHDLDTENCGSVNFSEFALGMTNCPSSASLTTEETIRMQEAFYNYNEVIRRTDIIKKSNNSLRSDADRYAQLKKLFEFPPCPVYEIKTANTGDAIVLAMIKSKKMNSILRIGKYQKLKDERTRSRTAKEFFEKEKKEKEKKENESKIFILKTENFSPEFGASSFLPKNSSKNFSLNYSTDIFDDEILQNKNLSSDSRMTEFSTNSKNYLNNFSNSHDDWHTTTRKMENYEKRNFNLLDNNSKNTFHFEDSNSHNNSHPHSLSQYRRLNPLTEIRRNRFSSEGSLMRNILPKPISHLEK